MNKLKTLKAAKLLQSGGLFGHHTATIAGIAASPTSEQGIKKLQRFKQRQAPFLLLADSTRTALKQTIYISPTLRKLAKESWPGAVTLVFRAKKQFNASCYQGGYIAVRVDTDTQTWQLAKACGGLLLSSSFNRKSKPVQPLKLSQRYRWQRHLSGILSAKPEAQNKPSKIFKVLPHAVVQLR